MQFCARRFESQNLEYKNKIFLLKDTIYQVNILNKITRIEKVHACIGITFIIFYSFRSEIIIYHKQNMNTLVLSNGKIDSSLLEVYCAYVDEL